MNEISKESSLDLYIARLDNFAILSPSIQVDYLAYYIGNQSELHEFSVKDIEGHFSILALRPYSRLSAYLSESTGKKNSKYIKTKNGYRLERATFDAIRKKVDSEPQRIQVSQQLIDIASKVKDTQESSFLEEAIRCYRVEAFRASIVMIWTLTIDHLQKYVFSSKLNEFNKAISIHTDKKMKQIINYDDFSEFKESRFIELIRSANIISNDVRKILDEKLGIRNSAGHPSGINFTGHKTTEFALDLIGNVLLKY